MRDGVPQVSLTVPMPKDRDLIPHLKNAATVVQTIAAFFIRYFRFFLEDFGFSSSVACFFFQLFRINGCTYVSSGPRSKPS